MDDYKSARVTGRGAVHVDREEVRSSKEWKEIKKRIQLHKAEYTIDLEERVEELEGLIAQAKSILTQYMVPSGITAHKALGDLIELIDGWGEG